MARWPVAAVLAIAFAAFPAPAFAGWKTLVVNDRHPEGNSVTVLDTATDDTIATVPVGATPFGAAITPDALTAWIANFAGIPNPSPSLQPIDLSVDPPVAGAPIPSGAQTVHPVAVAITPDGTAAYSPGDGGNVLIRLDLTQDPPVRTTIALDQAAFHIAMTPDGRKAYLSAGASGGSSVIPVDLTTGTPGDAISVGSTPRGIAVTPDGTRVVVAVNGTDRVRVIDTSSDEVMAGGAVVPGANEIAMAPDGETAWVSTWNGTDEGATTAEDGFVVPVDLTGPAPVAGEPVDVKTNDVGQAWGIAITPDGRKLYVADGRFNPIGNTVTPVDLTATPPEAGDPITVGASPRWITITPDQAPVASLNVTAGAPGSPTVFDASGSTSASSDIARYDWDFGDGATATTATASTSHTYSQAGTYTAKVTLTTEGGTSTEQVFTGQTLSRNGGPSARVERSVQVAPDQPAVRLDPALVDFGRTAVTATPTRTVAVTNDGTAALQVGAIKVGGDHPGDFAVVDNTCGSVAPGASCGFGVQFTPQAVGDRRAQVSVESNAPGSPHVVTVLGAATDRAVLTGRVADESGAGISGAAVEACLANGAACSRNTSGVAGRYRIAGLVPGDYELRAFPPSRDFTTAEAAVTLAAADERTQDVTMRRVPSFSKQLSLLTPGGLFTSGRPSVYWNDPLTFQYEVTDLPREAPPGTAYTVRVAFTLTSGGHSETWAETARVTYGADRAIDKVTSPSQPARRRPRIAQSTNCDVLLSLVREDFDLLKNEELELQKAGGGPVFGGFIGALRLRLAQEQLKEYEESEEAYTRANCDPKKLEEVFRPKPFPKAGKDVKVDVTSTVTKVPGGEPEDDGAEATGYIDPSGTVRTTHDVPLRGARVVLERRESPFAPFGAVPNGDVLMSPGNRRNPDRTDQTGRFGWDVLAGTYRVRARRAGCRAPRGRGRNTFTRALDVPPPRLNLVLRLRCRNIRRTPSRLTLRPRGSLLVARVRPRTARRTRRTRPLGTVTFRVRRRVIAIAPVDPRTGLATANVTRPPRALRAAYSGDALFGPSRAR